MCCSTEVQGISFVGSTSEVCHHQPLCNLQNLCPVPPYFWWMCRNRDPSLTAHHSSSPICNAAQAQASHPICPHHVVPFLRVCLGDKLTNQLLGAPSLGRYFRHLNLIVALDYSPNSKGVTSKATDRTTTTDYKNDCFRSILSFNFQ